MNTPALQLAALPVLAVLAFGESTPAVAAKIDSTYTKLDLDRDCTFYESHESGGSAKCRGFGEMHVWFHEGDLRQMVRFGVSGDNPDRWESFSQFNRVNDTVEWRLNNGKPFATILRWFIENENPTPTAARNPNEGQVLVVSKVATAEEGSSCIVGYVDARANTNANALARKVADDLAADFDCKSDLPVFHGVRGPYAGQPGRLGN